MSALRLIPLQDELHDWQDDGDGPFRAVCGILFAEARKVEAYSRPGSDVQDQES